MRSLSLLAALSALPAVISGFENTSPFFIFSPNRLPPSTIHLSTLPASQPQSTSTFLSAAHAVIAQCAAEAYVLVHQPALHAAHLQDAAPPHLRNALRRFHANRLLLPHVRPGAAAAAGVDAPSDVDTLEHWAHVECSAETITVEATTGAFAPFDDMRPKVLRVEFPAIPAAATEKERKDKIREMDVFLFSVLDLLPTDNYVVIFTSSPVEAPAAAMAGEVHGAEKMAEEVVLETVAPVGAMGVPETELKARAVAEEEEEAQKKRKDDDDDDDDEDDDKHGKLPANASLFQRYVFFSPAVWMGYTAAFFMLAIAYVALSAIGSLKVSYGAFEKEMAPAASKK